MVTSGTFRRYDTLKKAVFNSIEIFETKVKTFAHFLIPSKTQMHIEIEGGNEALLLAENSKDFESKMLLTKMIKTVFFLE